MRFNRIILAISCGAGLALVGACSDGGSHLTSPVRVPAAKATVIDTFCCGIQPQTKTTTTTTTSTSTTTAPDTFVVSGH